MNSLVGIDKVIFTTKEYELSKNNDFIQNYSQEGTSGTIKETKKVLNRSGLFQSDINWHGARVIFNPSKIIGNQLGSSYHLTTSSNELNSATELILNELESAGLKLPNYDAIRISRLDLAKDVETIHPTSDYFPAMSMLGGNRLKKRNEPSTYYIGNQQRQFCLYDKGIEMFDESNNLTKHIIGNITRLESRSLRTKEVDKTLNIKTLKELMNYSNDAWSNQYHSMMKEQVFKVSKGNAPSTLTLNHQQQLIEYYGGQKEFEQVLMKSALLEYYGTPEDMRMHLAASGMKRSGILKKITQCKIAMQKRTTIDKYKNKETTSTLMHELIDKFTKAA